MEGYGIAQFGAESLLWSTDTEYICPNFGGKGKDLK